MQDGPFEPGSEASLAEALRAAPPVQRIRGASASDSSLEKSDLRSLLIEFRIRSAGYARQSYLSQAFICICIFGGIFLFWYSDRIALENRIREITSIGLEIDGHNEMILKTEKYAQNLKKEQDALLPESPPGGAQRLPDDSQIEYLNRRLKDIRDRIFLAEAQITDMKSKLGTLERYRDVRRTEPQEQVAIAVATKIGSVLLLLFFVRVLVSIFRYHSRLAIFFQARADALGNQHLVEGLKISEFVALISPDAVEFEKTPDSPDPPVITLFKEVLAARAKQG